MALFSTILKDVLGQKASKQQEPPPPGVLDPQSPHQSLNLNTRMDPVVLQHQLLRLQLAAAAQQQRGLPPVSMPTPSTTANQQPSRISPNSFLASVAAAAKPGPPSPPGNIQVTDIEFHNPRLDYTIFSLRLGYSRSIEELFQAETILTH